MDRGVFIDRTEAEHTALADLLDRYEQEVTPIKRGAAKERSHIEVLHHNSIAPLPIAAITGKAMSQHRDSRLKEVSASTVNRELNLLSHVFTVAQNEWHLHLPWGNPVALIRRPKVEDRRDRRLLPREEKLLLKAAAGDQRESIAAIIVVVMEMALRRGEMAAMRWEHLDRTAHVLAVPETKTGDLRRAPVSSQAMKTLLGQAGNRNRHPEGPVFGVHADSITCAFDRAVQRAHKAYIADCQKKGATPDARMLADLRLDDLRHEATSRLFEKGLNPMRVAAITGHKTLQMLKRYTHLRAEDLVALIG